VNAVIGEGEGTLRRSGRCDALSRALVAESFYESYPDAVGQVRDLRPTSPRIDMNPNYRPTFEEFYDANTTTRSVTLNLRPCQTAMFLHRARRDDGRIADPQVECLPPDRPTSTLERAPVGLVSSVYAETKQLRGSEDVIWGFHPLSFELEDVQDALLWICESRWQLPVMH
jgi:hypothetical protein